MNQPDFIAGAVAIGIVAALAVLSLSFLLFPGKKNKKRSRVVGLTILVSLALGIYVVYKASTAKLRAEGALLGAQVCSNQDYRCCLSEAETQFPFYDIESEVMIRGFVAGCLQSTDPDNEACDIVPADKDAAMAAGLYGPQCSSFSKVCSNIHATVLEYCGTAP
ncbi:MAG: hypothetical protein AAGF72_03915 [Pseudomonadota bacterium]